MGIDEVDLEMDGELETTEIDDAEVEIVEIQCDDSLIVTDPAQVVELVGSMAWSCTGPYSSGTRPITIPKIKSRVEKIDSTHRGEMQWQDVQLVGAGMKDRKSMTRWYESAVASSSCLKKRRGGKPTRRTDNAIQELITHPSAIISN